MIAVKCFILNTTLIITKLRCLGVFVIHSLHMYSIKKDIITGLTQIAYHYPTIVAVYLFGSYAYGKPMKSSDIDIGIVCSDKSKLDVRLIALQIEKLLRPIKTDVVVVDLTDSPLLLTEMLRGKVIYQKNIDERAMFERQIIKLNEDFAAREKIRRIYLDQSFKSGVYAA